MGKKTKKKNSMLSKEKIYLMPIIFILAVIPLIVKAHITKTYLEDYNWFPYMNDHVDVFFYYKHVYIILTGLCMLGMLGYRIYKDRTMKLTKIFIPLAIYGVLAILSTVFSENHNFSLNGNYSHFESIFVLLSYFIICFYTYIFIKDEEDLQYCMKYFNIGILLVGLLGFSQYIGHNFYKTNIGKVLISSKEVPSEGFDFTETLDKVYASLFNPNYVGVYASMIIPVLLASLWGGKEDCKKNRICNTITSSYPMLKRFRFRSGIYRASGGYGIGYHSFDL